MAHPLIWSNVRYFYPIGNTPPVCLTRALAPEESSTILLLGAGDPRSVLFTLSSTVKLGESLLSSMDITCCDIEPGIFARNILLFTLIIECDVDKAGLLWNIFYDMFVTDSVASLISLQCEKLAQASQSLQEWNGHPFGSYIRMCNAETLENLRRFWLLYAEFHSLPPDRRERVQKAFKNHLDSSRGVTYHLSSARSAGPRWQNLLVPISIHGNHYRHTGVTSMRESDVKAAQHVNPTFAYSFMGEGCAVHYETQPLAAFHLAAAPVDNRADMIKGSAGRASAAELLQFARAQFAMWCATFKSVVQDVDSSFVIRFHIGDALSFCQALDHVRLTSSINTPFASSWWRGSMLKLDGGDYASNSDTPAPFLYNIIDTSNLMDHVGPLNLLLVTQPLLSGNSSATLYTESLVEISKDAIQTFDDYLCGDLTTVSLFLDLTPSTFLSQFSTTSSGYEIMMDRISDSGSLLGRKGFQQRLAWKRPSTLVPDGDALSLIVEPSSLSRFLFSIYLKMFSNESPGFYGLLHHTRTTFATLLKTVKLRLSPSTSWHLVMRHLLRLIETDRTLLIGLNNYQDFCCQMHLLNVYTISPLQDIAMHPLIRPSMIYQSHFRDWKEAPTFVCLTLLVPRDRIQAVLDSKPATPTLLCSIGEYSCSSFSTLFGAFGTIQTVGDGSDMTLLMQEDLDGLFGSSSMIISCYVPTWILVVDPCATVTLAFSPNIATLCLVGQLGDQLAVYETKLIDKAHVFITQERPTPCGSANPGFVTARSTLERTTTADINCVSISFDSSGSRVIKFSRRIDIVDVDSRFALSSGAHLKDEQSLPSQITVKYGSHHQDFHFPFPVDGSSTRLRVARKTFYIEAIVSPSAPFGPGGFSVHPFLVLRNHNQFTLWSLDRVQLDTLPLASLMDHSRNDWVQIHLSIASSRRESDLREDALRNSDVPKNGPKHALADMKATITTMFCQFLALGGHQRFRVFGLYTRTPYDLNVIVFIHKMRMDPSAFTIVLDAYVLPWRNSLLPKIMTLESSISRIQCSSDEQYLWEMLLPALAERSRHGWHHRSECEYNWNGNVLDTSGIGRQKLCRCGEGKSVDGFREVKGWSHLAAFVTRVAISPLFAISYLENFGRSFADSGTPGGDTDQLARTWEQSRTTLEQRPSCNYDLEGLARAVYNQSGGQSPRKTDTEVCTVCGTVGQIKLMRCSKCKKVKYCSTKCQREDWKTHKPHCRNPSIL